MALVYRALLAVLLTAQLSTVGAFECDGQNYTECRRQLVLAVFNTTDGKLPSKSTPDYIEDLSNWTMNGLPGPGEGTGVGDVSWRMNLHKLVWTIGPPGGGMRDGMLRLNTTVWYSRNTTGDAPSNSPPVAEAGDSPHCPDSSRPGYESWAGQSDTLVIHHNGHSGCSGSVPQRKTHCSDCTPNYDTVQDWLNQLGYDVMEMAMPLHGCNRVSANLSCSAHCVSNSARGFDCGKCVPTGQDDSLIGFHQWFDQFEAQGDDVMRYFLEPVVLVTNYALNVLKYKNVVMVGLSGGGWTTTISAALDPRIKLSLPVAGSMPKSSSVLYSQWVPDLPEGRDKGEGAGGDFEQDSSHGGRPFYQVCGWACLYVLAATPATPGGPARHSLQMVHEHDSCCFATAGVHRNITEYNEFVQSQLANGSWFQTSANWGNFHEINYRDKTTIGIMIERLRRPGGIKLSHYEDLPFNIIGV